MTEHEEDAALLEQGAYLLAALLIVAACLVAGLLLAYLIEQHVFPL